PRRLTGGHLQTFGNARAQMTREEANRLLHAYIDGELDAVKSLELEAHLAGNPSVRAACERLREMSAAIRDKADYHAAPAWLEERVRAAIPAEPKDGHARPAWWGWLKPPGSFAAVADWLRPAASFAAVALVTWVVALGVMRPSEDERITQDVLASHVRATLSSRSYDVASSDQHTVKPWLSARLAFSPPVADLSASDFELVGARLTVSRSSCLSFSVLNFAARSRIVFNTSSSGGGSPWIQRKGLMRATTKARR